MAKNLSPGAAEKARQRRLFRRQWDVMIGSENKWQSLQEQLQNHLIAYLKTQTGTWSSYQALATEIHLQPVIQQASHLRWVFPVMTGSSLQFYVPGLHGMVQKKFGIHEPHIEDAELVPKETVSGFLIPGLGFDRSGNRLGKGLGFYDRTLQGVRGLKVGISFSQFIVEKLPFEDWDICMDVLATETGVYKVSSK